MLGPFEGEGELTWAVLAPIDASEMEARIVTIEKKLALLDDDQDGDPEPRPGASCRESVATRR